MSESSPQLIEVGSNVANNDQLLSILQVQPSDGNSNEVGVPIQLVQGGEEVDGQEALVLQPQAIEVNGERHVILQQAQDPNTGELLVFFQGENGEAITLPPEALSGGLVQVSGEGNDQVLTLALPQDGEAGSMVVVTELNSETSATGVISDNTNSVNSSRVLTNIPPRESTHTSSLPSSSTRSSSSSYPSTFTAGTTLVQSVETPRVTAHQIDSTSSTIDLNVSSDKANINPSTEESSSLHPLITAVNSITESKSKGVEIPRKLTAAEAFDKAVLGKEINLDDRSHSFTKSSVSNKELKLASKNLLSSIKSGHSSNSTNYGSVIQVEESESSAPLEALIANTVVSGSDNNYVIMTTNEEGGLPTEINLAEVLNANSASGQTFFLQTSKGLVACTAATKAEDGSIQLVTDSSGNTSVLTGGQNHEQNLDSQVIQSLSGSQTLAYTLSSTTSGIELTPVTSMTSNYGSKTQTFRGNKNSRQSKSKTLTMTPGGETLLLPSRASLSTHLSSQASSTRKRNASSRSTSSVSVTITPASISSPIIPVQPDTILTSNDAFSHISKSSSSLSNPNDISLLTSGIPGVSQLAASRRTYSKKNNILWLNPDQAAITSSSKTQTEVSNSNIENCDTVTQASNKATSSSIEKGKSKNETLSVSKIGNWSEKLKTSMEVTLVDKPPQAVSSSQKSTKDFNLTPTTISSTETSENKGKSETSTLTLPLNKKLTELKLNTNSKSTNEVVQDTKTKPKSDVSGSVGEKTASSTSSTSSTLQKPASNINIIDTATTTITTTKSPRKDMSLSVVIMPKEDEAKDKLDVNLTSLNKSPIKSPIKSTSDERLNKLDQSLKSPEKVPYSESDKSKADLSRSEKLSTVQSVSLDSSLFSPSDSKINAFNTQAEKETTVMDEENSSPPKSNSISQLSKKDENVTETKDTSQNTSKDSKSELKDEAEESKGNLITEIVSKKCSRSNSQNKEVDLKSDELAAIEDDKRSLSNSPIKSTRSTRLKTDSVKNSQPNLNESTVEASSLAAAKRKESKVYSNDDDKSQSNKKSCESIDNDKTKTSSAFTTTGDTSLTSNVDEDSCSKLLKSSSDERNNEPEISHNDDHDVSKDNTQFFPTKSDSNRKRQTRLESLSLKNSKLSSNESSIKENDANDEKEASLPKMTRSKVTKTESSRKRHSNDVHNSSQESNLDVENFSSPVKKRVGFNLPSSQDQASPKNEKTPKSKKLNVNKSSSQPCKLTPIIKFSPKSSSSPELGKKERVSLVVSYGPFADGNEEKSQLRNSVTSLSDLRSSSEFYDFDSSECSFHVRHQTSNLVSFTPRGSGGNYTCQKCGYRTSRMNNLVLHHKDQCPVVKDAVRLHWQNEINKQTKRHAEKPLSNSKLVIKKKKTENNLSSFSSSLSSSSSSSQPSSMLLSTKGEEEEDFRIENEEPEEESVFNKMDNKALEDVKESIQANLESNLLNQSDDEEELANRKNSEYKKRYGYCESEVVWAEVNSVHWPALVTKVNESCKNVTLRFIECPFSRKR